MRLSWAGSDPGRGGIGGPEWLLGAFGAGQFTDLRAGPLQFSAPWGGWKRLVPLVMVTRVRFRVAELFNPLPMPVPGSAQVSQVCL